ncbi:hypothetical protein ACNOYE_34745 [Nannocystaceae bacterium ST9]
MNVLKILGWISLGGILIGGAVAGGVYLHRRRQAKDKATPGPTPSKPPRDTEDARKPDADPAPKRNAPDFEYVGGADGPDEGLRASEKHLNPSLVAEMNAMFGDIWPPDDAAIDKLEYGDVVVCAVESKPTEDFDNPQQEIINASVLSVEKTEVRARVISPVAYTNHHGNEAGHGIYVGALLEVPRSKILGIARRKPPEKPTGYGSKGAAANTLKGSDHTKQVYKVHPGTPYDLVLPYRTENLHWYPSRDNVKFEQVGEKGLLHQILFTEASVRGPYSVSVLDHDEKAGKVFVARWDFELAE